MQSISIKTKLLTLILIAIASIATACSGNSQADNSVQNSKPVSVQADKSIQNPNGVSAEGSQHEQMNHGGGTNHNMDLGPADANYDLRFIDGMILHHQGAVVMAKDVLAKSKRPELLKLGKDIIAAQDKEIAQMKKWRQTWYPQASATPMAWNSQMNHMMAMSPEQIKAMRMDVDLGAADGEYDLRFIKAMIPHHEGAVVMAQDLLQKSKRPELQKLAKDVIASQQTEIDQMKEWQQTWYNQ
ncbi:MAG: DUF305 domain-containing protein [Cyanosarcina radialis HA8281-LM2]|jgi:uncharacterized protein (DUF305 family)|nr:DUF305 domain-containing protein [Cyanosarcina radialis HA8281-LM2]